MKLANNLSITRISMLFFSLASVLSGCFIVPPHHHDDDDNEYDNTAPFLSDLYVSCSWVSAYSSYEWVFDSYVYDEDGLDDIEDVFVDIYDDYYHETYPVETLHLFSEGDGYWSISIYEYNGAGDPSNYSQYLSCDYYEDFYMQFYAYDYYGAYDTVLYYDVLGSPINY